MGERRDAPQAANEGPEGTDTPTTGAGAQEGSELRPERSWWRRWFGFD